MRLPDPVKSRTRQMLATLKRRAAGQVVMSLDELRAEFDAFMRIGGRCTYCGVRVSHVTVSLDHRIPVKRGGWHTMTNLAFCCRSCNSSKGNLTDREYESLLRYLDLWEAACKNFTLKTALLTTMKVGHSFRIGANRRAKR